jgi:hypothetical protein
MAVLRRQIRCWPDELADTPPAKISLKRPEADEDSAAEPGARSDASPDSPGERLVTFLTNNGYQQLTDHERQRLDELSNSLQRPPADADAIFARGTTAAGWWSSDQSDLRSLVAIYRREDDIEVQWAVDTSGQWLTDDDEHFWDREANHARRAVQGDISEFPDFRAREERRSDRISRNTIRTGLLAALLTFACVVLLFLLGAV